MDEEVGKDDNNNNPKNYIAGTEKDDTWISLGEMNDFLDVSSPPSETATHRETVKKKLDDKAMMSARTINRCSVRRGNNINKDNNEKDESDDFVDYPSSTQLLAKVVNDTERGEKRKRSVEACTEIIGDLNSKNKRVLRDREDFEGH